MQPGHSAVEPAFPEATVESLLAKGHRVDGLGALGGAGCLCAVARSPDGVLKGAATPRLMQAYAVGR